MDGVEAIGTLRDAVIVPPPAQKQVQVGDNLMIMGNTQRCHMKKAFFSAAFFCMVLLLISPAITHGDDGIRLLTQRTFGVDPAVVKYSEYSYNGKIVSVIFIDPKSLSFSVSYANPPKKVSEFHDSQPGVLLTLNGGYWDNKHFPTDLCISNGQIIKAVNTQNKHFGLFAVDNNDSVLIDDLEGKPLSTADLGRFKHALKSGPHLVRSGKALTFNASTSYARTVVAKDEKGNVLFIANKTGTMTYQEMATFLLNAGLGVAEAFNLDGGSSTGFALGRGTDLVMKDSVGIADVIQVR